MFEDMIIDPLLLLAGANTLAASLLIYSRWNAQAVVQAVVQDEDQAEIQNKDQAEIQNEVPDEVYAEPQVTETASYSELVCDYDSNYGDVYELDDFIQPPNDMRFVGSVMMVLGAVIAAIGTLIATGTLGLASLPGAAIAGGGASLMAAGAGFFAYRNHKSQRDADSCEDDEVYASVCSN